MDISIQIRVKGIVYKLVQHYAHTCKVKLHSDMFQWRSLSSLSRKTTSQTKNTAAIRCLPCYARIAMFRVRLQSCCSYVIQARIRNCGWGVEKMA